MDSPGSRKIYVARQPIFDIKRRIYGYELLFRSSFENSFDFRDGTEATSQVLIASFIEFGLPSLTQGKKALINLNRDVLEKGYLHLFPSDQVVAEILETVPPEPRVLDACRKLKDAGFLLALDDFCKLEGFEPLADLANIIKVDFVETDDKQQSKLVDQFAGKNIRLLAEKVESYEDFERAADLGYHYFQGFFFARPEIFTRREITSSKLHNLQLLQSMQKREIDMDELERIIKEDVSLSYRLLRYINSSFFSRPVEIHSIRQALVLLGGDETRKWATLIAVSRMGEDKPEALLATALTRARFCEAFASIVMTEDQASDLFLLGLFSVLDAILDRPLPEILKEVPIADGIVSALLGEPGPHFDILQLVKGYEAGDWAGVEEATTRLSSTESAIPEVYIEAVDWANDCLGSVAVGV